MGGAFLQQRLESHLLEAALTRQGFGHILRQWDGSAKQQTCSNAGRASAQQSLLHALHWSKKNQTSSKNQVESSESTGMQTSIQSNVAIICTVVENVINTGVGCAFWLATCKTFMPASDGCCSNHCAIVIEVHVSLGRNSSNCQKFYSCDQSLPLQERKNPSVSLFYSVIFLLAAMAALIVNSHCLEALACSPNLVKPVGHCMSMHLVDSNVSECRNEATKWTNKFPPYSKKARSGPGRGQRSGCFNLSTWAEKHSTGNQKTSN